MATPNQLVKTVSGLLGVPEATVIQIDRVLADAGLRTKGGRGLHSATMGPKDAANLLMAVAGNTSVASAQRTCNTYSSLPFKPRFANEDGSWTLEPLRSLAPQHTFGEALTALIAAATDGSLSSAINNTARTHPLVPNLTTMEVVLWGPYPQASIRLYSNHSDAAERHDYSNIPTETDKVMEWAAELERNPHGDLSVMRTFTGRTVWGVAKLLSGAKP